MAMRTPSRDAASERFKRRKSALSLQNKWFCFRGLLSTQRARLTAAITAASGQIFDPKSKSSSTSNKPDVVYVITDYWVDTLLLPRSTACGGDSASDVVFVSVTEFWLREMLRTQEWLDLDAHVFFTPPPRPQPGAMRNTNYLSYPENYSEQQQETGGSGPDANAPLQKLLMNLPCSLDNKWRDQVPFWPYYVAYLNFPMRNARELAAVLKCITGTEPRRQLNSLEIALNDMLSNEQRDDFFKKLLPEMMRLVLNLPTMFATRPEVLGPFFDQETSVLQDVEAQPSRLQERSWTFTKREALALVSACFFCIFPSQNRVIPKQKMVQDSEEQYTEGEEDGEIEFPYFSMRSMFSSPSNGGSADLKAQKIRCVLQYFLRVVPLVLGDDTECGRLDNEVITFTRVAVSLSPSTKKSFEMKPQDLLDSLNITSQAQLTMGSVRCESDHLIEDLDDHLQIDFANKYAGGGVFNSGCVQEEIRFLLSPELFIACLVFAKLEPNESFVIHGTERYCLYGGYGSNFFFKGNYDDQTGFEVIAADGTANGKRRRKCVIVGIDAVDYGSFSVGRQYTRVHIWRDLVKAFVGFAYPDSESASWPVATGNWGCGVFRGDAELKFIIQWLAASLAGRDLVYVLFERDHELHESILELLQVFEGVAEESEKQRVPQLVAQFLLGLDEILTRRLNAQRNAGKRATRPSVLALAHDFLDMQLQGLKRLKLSSPSQSEKESKMEDLAKEKMPTSPPVTKIAQPSEAPKQQEQSKEKDKDKQKVAPAKPNAVAHTSPQKKQHTDGKGLQQKSIHEFFSKK